MLTEVLRFLFGRRTAARWKVHVGIDGHILDDDRAVTADGYGEGASARLEGLRIPRAKENGVRSDS